MGAPHNISMETIDNCLFIEKGSAQDPSAMRALFAANPTHVVSGLGGSPKMTFSPYLFTLDQPTITEDAMTTMIQTLQQLRDEGLLKVKPHVTMISTAGIAKNRDVPLALVPLYHWLLAVPHHDKRAGEAVLVKESAKPELERVISGWTLVRPPLLTDCGSVDRVLVGWERHDLLKGKDIIFPSEKQETAPVLGNTFPRANVGKWIFENIVQDGGEVWKGRCVTLAH